MVLLLGEEASARPPLALLIPLGQEAFERLLPVAQAVRAAGVEVDLGHGDRKLRTELERANKLGVTYALIVGSDELARGEAVLREMKSGEQRGLSLGGLAAELRALGGRA